MIAQYLSNTNKIYTIHILQLNKASVAWRVAVSARAQGKPPLSDDGGGGGGSGRWPAWDWDVVGGVSVVARLAGWVLARDETRRC